MSNKTFLIAMATDSLSMPRPWNQKKPNLNPELATNYFHTYPYKLKKLLQHQFKTLDIELNNYSARAGGIGTIALKIRDIVSWLGADVGVLHFGITDCWLRGENFDIQNTSAEVFLKVFLEMMELKKNLNNEGLLVIIGITPTNQHMLNKAPTQNEQIRKYNALIKENLGENCHYIDMENLFETYGETILHPDGHHLSNTGHDLVANMLSTTIAPVMQHKVTFSEAL